MKNKTKNGGMAAAKLDGMGSSRYAKTVPALEAPPVWKIWRPQQNIDLNRDGTIVFDMTTHPNEAIL